MKNNPILENVASVHQRIENAALAAGRDAAAVRLIAVSKRIDTDSIQQAYQSGLRDFGESYINESVTKISELQSLDICWHFIGPVQSNKTKLIAQHFHWLHSLCSINHARKLNRHRGDFGLPPLKICLQINLSGEDTKSGTQQADLFALSEAIAELEHLQLRGLMTLPAPATTEEAQRAPFQQLAQLQHELQSRGHALDTLSMGMSNDLEAAILEGATMVRIGTDVFGKRPT